jgi:hypothetical protein
VLSTNLIRAASYPRVQFTAIVNVHSGPGEGALPNAEYSHAIETLNSFANIRTVGYVATTWCTRNLSLDLDEVAAYSFWGEYDESIAIDGILVDETPTQYTPDYASYLQTIAKAVHESDGLRDGYIGKATISSRHRVPCRAPRKPEPYRVLPLHLFILLSWMVPQRQLTAIHYETDNMRAGI